MFIHNFIYAFKTLFRNKMLIFWTFAFPIILGTLFNMAFSNIENSEKLKIINIAIIQNENFENNEAFKTSFEELSDEDNEDRLFNTQYTTEEKAKELLDNGKIVGYMKLKDDKPILTFATNGIDETIFKYVTEEIEQTTDIIKNLSETEIQKDIVFSEKSGSKEPVIQKTTMPVIQGAIITAEGAGDATVKTNIINAVSAVTALSIDKIQVFEKQK